MNRIETYLNSIDIKQKIMIYLMIFGLIGYLFYNYSDSLITENQLLQNDVRVLKDNIERDLTKNLKIKIAKQEKSILKLKSEYENKKSEINFLLSGLYKLKFAFYDKKEWAKSIDSILRNSIERDIKIKYIKSEDIIEEKSDNLLKKRKSLEISGSGKFINIVAFISYVDNLNMLLKFTKVDIKEGKENLDFILYIDMYGIGL